MLPQNHVFFSICEGDNAIPDFRTQNKDVCSPRKHIDLDKTANRQAQLVIDIAQNDIA